MKIKLPISLDVDLNYKDQKKVFFYFLRENFGWTEEHTVENGLVYKWIEECGHNRDWIKEKVREATEEDVHLDFICKLIRTKASAREINKFLGA